MERGGAEGERKQTSTGARDGQQDLKERPSNTKSLKELGAS